MERLIAKYALEMHEGYIVKRQTDDEPSFAANIDGFDVTVTIKKCIGANHKSKAERLMTRSRRVIELSVSRSETVAPPTVVPDENAHLDWTVQTDYFNASTTRYTAAAVYG